LVCRTQNNKVRNIGEVYNTERVQKDVEVKRENTGAKTEHIGAQKKVRVEALEYKELQTVCGLGDARLWWTDCHPFLLETVFGRVLQLLIPVFGSTAFRYQDEIGYLFQQFLEFLFIFTVRIKFRLGI
jgi:hypothetical protein